MDLTPVEPKLLLLAHAKVTVAQPLMIGAVTGGERRIIPITGGKFEGSRLRGDIISGGADWQLVRADGTAFLDARYTLKTDNGALIYIHNTGIRHGAPEVLAAIAKGEEVDPHKYYFRTTPTFETGDKNYDWLNKMVAVCSGVRTREAVFIDYYEVL